MGDSSYQSRAPAELVSVTDPRLGRPSDSLLTLPFVLVVAVVSVGSVFWMHTASLVQAPGQVYAPVYLLSVPPVPAIFALILLVAIQPLSRRIRILKMSSRQLLVLYAILVIVVPPVTYGIASLMLPTATVGPYLAAPHNNYGALAESLPRWAYPQDPEVVRTMFEGSADGLVPWRAWIYPLSIWTLWMTLIFTTLLCLMALFHRQWSQHERLRYPLLFIPLSVVEKQAVGSKVPFFRNPLVWIGISLVIAHHALNVANAYNPSVIALTDRTRFGQYIFTEYPWTAFRWLQLFHRPQVIGLAYFVPLDILFSGWFFYLAQSGLVFVSSVLGLTAAADFPFTQSQLAGGYVAMVTVLLWVARHQLTRIARGALRGDVNGQAREEPLSHRAALLGAVGGFAALVLWTWKLGVPLGYAAVFFGLVLAGGFVLARIRAEAGIPTMWGSFMYLQSVFEFTGSRHLTAAGSLAPLAVLRLYNWVSRGYLQSMSAYQCDNFKLADEAGIRPRIMSVAMIIAFVIGCALAYYFILSSYYQQGALVLYGGGSTGGYNIDTATLQWSLASSEVDAPSLRDQPRAIATIAGAVAVLLMTAARWRWLRLPFHPVGYVSCVKYGYCLWFPFMLAWGAKLLVTRLGGARLYRQLMPFFLGLAFGDLLAGGLSWIIMALFGPDILGGYMVQFG